MIGLLPKESVITQRVVGNAKVIRESSSVPRSQNWFLESFQDTSSPNSLIAGAAARGTDPRGADRRFRKIKFFGEDNFLRFPGFRCLQVPCLWCEEKRLQRFGS